MRDAIRAAETGRAVRASRRTVEDFLREWLPAVRASLRATTWANYMDYCRAYVIPVVGQSRLADLTPMRLNLLYGHLLEHGRVTRAGRAGAQDRAERPPHAASRAQRRGPVGPTCPATSPRTRQPPQGQPRKPRRSGPRAARAPSSTTSDGDRFYALWLLVATTGLPPRRTRRPASARHRPRTTAGSPRAFPASSWPAGPRVRDQDPQPASAPWRSTPTPRTRCATTSTLGRGARGCWARTRELLFVWPDGRPLHPDTITALFHRHCAAAGLPRIRLHDVRHSYATAALKAGVPAKVDQRAARARHRGLHPADLHPRHPGHGPRPRPTGRRPDPRPTATDARTRDGRISVTQSGHRTTEKETDLGQSPRPAVVAGAGFEPATSGL